MNKDYIFENAADIVADLEMLLLGLSMSDNADVNGYIKINVEFVGGSSEQSN